MVGTGWSLSGCAPVSRHKQASLDLQRVLQAKISSADRQIFRARQCRLHQSDILRYGPHVHSESKIDLLQNDHLSLVGERRDSSVSVKVWASTGLGCAKGNQAALGVA